MIIAPAPTRDIQPESTLTHWGIVQSPTGELYFVGHCVERGASCFSTPVQFFDPEEGKGITLSGRVYRLVGDHGLDAEGLFMVNIFTTLNAMAYIDVTAHMLTSVYSKMH